jgi:hypothetical protein
MEYTFELVCCFILMSLLYRKEFDNMKSNLLTVLLFYYDIGDKVYGTV